ncbi:MAG: sulfotransferase family protein [Steroidobacteraceae bacterium]
MNAKNPPISAPIDQLTTALNDALDLLKEFSNGSQTATVPRQNPASLLEQCRALCAQHQAATPDPIRLVHHFACTGGTLISKCIATMPNVQLLSEVDPLSTTPDQPIKPRFAASDMVTLMRQSTRGVNQDFIIEMFLNNLELIHANTVKLGQRLILRDHAHSHFCLGGEIPERPSLSAMVSSRFPVRSVVTVRHPLDSFLSLEANGWVHFTPSTFDEYCKRYLTFLRTYHGVAIIKYENFVDAPEKTMRNLCFQLDIPYLDKFVDLFSVFELTGESGRSGDSIQHQPRRTVGKQLERELEQSSHYRILVDRLAYGG